MNEKWKPVLGYEGLYEVSDQGRVRSIERKIMRSNGAPQTIPARIRKGAVNKKRGGCIQVTLYKEAQYSTRLVHRLVLEAFVGPCPEGMEGCHWDGNPENNSVFNLRWDTPIANAADKRRHGTHNSTVKTHCLRGHPLAEPNLIPSSAKNGYRRCLACNRAMSQVRYHEDRKDLFAEIADEYYAAIIDSHKEP